MNDLYYIPDENKIISVSSGATSIPENAIKLTLDEYNEIIEKINLNYTLHVYENENKERKVGFTPPPLPLIEDIFKDKISLIAQVVSNFSEQEINKLLNYAPQIEINTWAFKLQAAEKILSKAELSESEKLFFQYATYDTDEKRLEWSMKVIANSKITSIVYGIYEYFRTLTKTFIKTITIDDVKQSILDKKIVDKLEDIDYKMFEEELTIILNTKTQNMKIEANAKITNLLDFIHNTKK